MQIGQRIIIVGVTGSGKTTLAKRLATRRGLPHVELDALHWDANWTPAPPEVFRQRASQALSGERWVTDGNYSVIREVVWQRADTLIWLDYPLSLILWRLWWRTLWRTTRRLELWNGNHETWRGAFFSRDSLFFWALKTHKKRRREYPELFTRPEHAHLSITRFRSPRATQQWLASLKPQAEHPSL
jgi:adenylate kinase family enzyme